MLDPNTSSESDAPAPSDAQLRQAIEYLYYAYRSFTERPDKILDKRGLGRVHHRILYFVGRNPGTTVNALLSTLQVSKQALNAPLRQLLAMQLIGAQTAHMMGACATFRSPAAAPNWKRSSAVPKWRNCAKLLMRRGPRRMPVGMP